jgi:hypothetical protein
VFFVLLFCSTKKLHEGHEVLLSNILVPEASLPDHPIRKYDPYDAKAITTNNIRRIVHIQKDPADAYEQGEKDEKYQQKGFQNF